MSPETMTRREASRDKRTVQSALPRAIEVIFCRLKAQIEKPCVRFCSCGQHHLKVVGRSLRTACKPAL